MLGADSSESVKGTLALVLNYLDMTPFLLSMNPFPGIYSYTTRGVHASLKAALMSDLNQPICSNVIL